MTSDLALFSKNPVTGRLMWGLGKTPRMISGTEKLIQVFVIALLETRTYDVFDPDEGGGLPGIVGQLNLNASGTTNQEVLAEIVEAVARVEAQIIKNQADVDLPKQEKLKSATVQEIRQNPDQIDEVFLRIRLVPEQGGPIDVEV